MDKLSYSAQVRIVIPAPGSSPLVGGEGKGEKATQFKPLADVPTDDSVAVIPQP